MLAPLFRFPQTTPKQRLAQAGILATTAPRCPPSAKPTRTAKIAA
jgi:hypothetical protein